ncbi:unnamed protein product [Vicia faba]|uniref:Protein kinase domain-containing protein n=1 Tax=Vicia faba TaxID=3906 RepID=A0AAV0YRY0_VICFA|nr:unnamed protein product [Vicia faba]
MEENGSKEANIEAWQAPRKARSSVHKYIHENDFVHCDLKPRNILVFENGNIKISDFGLAEEIGVEQGEKKHKGTPIFMSPESVMDVVYESPVDIWALGCTVVEILTREAAWNMGYDPNLLDRIVVRK